MGRIYKGVAELIGKTPLMEAGQYTKSREMQGRLLVKLESFNPAGSAKDRVALTMIEDAERAGILKKGAVIIEPTSGNTGIGLACIAAARGYEIILTMPESMSVERRKLLLAYGAKIVLTDGAKGMTGAIERAEELASEIPGSFIPGQFVNPSNPKSHRESTGPEIWEDTKGEIDFFVAGVGTGGTLTGVGEYLKEKDPSIQVIAVEPSGSPVLSGGYAGAHGLQGIGAGFIPEILDTGIYDEVIAVKEEDAYAAGRDFSHKEGILTGISAGAALYAAGQVLKRPENAGKTVVVLLPDSGERYLSTPLFQD